MNPTEMLKTRPTAQIDEFQPGDTVSVNMVIREGDRTRVQAFQGNVIAGRYRDDKVPNPGSTFKVRTCVPTGSVWSESFPYHSPSLESVKVTRRGKVRRSRLYYLRGLTGRHAPHQGTALSFAQCPISVGSPDTRIFRGNQVTTHLKMCRMSRYSASLEAQ